MKVLLVNCVINLEGWRGEIYHQGLGYIIAVLKQHNHGVEGMPLTNESDVLSFYDKVKAERPDVIGFSTTTNQFQYLKEIIPAVKKASPNSFIVCGGVHPTFQPDCIQDIPELDAIVRGEGEFPMLELVEAIKGKKDFHPIQNLSYRNGSGVVHNGIRPVISDLDSLPWPDTDWIGNKFAASPQNGLNTFMFSRGCIFECSYCSIKALNDLYHGKGRYFRLRSPAQALEEIKSRVAKYKLEYVRFDDNILNANRKWAAEFLTRYKAEIGIPFQCNMRSGNVDPEAVRLLKEAGCRCVIIGVEHGNEVFRKEVLNRSVTNKKIVDSFSYFSAQGMNCGIQLLVGLPFENRRLFLDTVRLCRQLPLHTHTLSIFSPYPGTALYKVCKEHNWLPDRVDRKERLEAIMSFPGFNREEIQLCFDLFPHLLKHKHIPLFVPLEWVRPYVKAIERWARPKA